MSIKAKDPTFHSTKQEGLGSPSPTETPPYGPGRIWTDPDPDDDAVTTTGDRSRAAVERSLRPVKETKDI